MKYRAILETAIGTINAVWNGGAYFDIFIGDDESPATTVNVWDYDSNEPWIDFTAKALALEVVRWFKESEPAQYIERVVCIEENELEQSEVCP